MTLAVAVVGVAARDIAAAYAAVCGAASVVVCAAAAAAAAGVASQRRKLLGSSCAGIFLLQNALNHFFGLSVFSLKQLALTQSLCFNRTSKQMHALLFVLF